MAALAHRAFTVTAAARARLPPPRQMRASMQRVPFSRSLADVCLPARLPVLQVPQYVDDLPHPGQSLGMMV